MNAEPLKAPEPFVSAEKAAIFLSITRRHLLQLARQGLKRLPWAAACAGYGFSVFPSLPKRLRKKPRCT